MIPDETPVGTPIFFDYDLFWVKGVLRRCGERSLFDVGNGYIETSTEPENCYPCTREFRSVADAIKDGMDRLHRDYGYVGLNFPDIARHARSLFGEAADLAQSAMKATKKDPDYGPCRAVIERWNEFVKAVVDACADAKTKKSQGVRIMGR